MDVFVKFCLIFTISAIIQNNNVIDAGYVLIAGGWTEEGHGNEVQALDTTSGLWSNMPNLPESLIGPAIAELNGVIYVMAGKENGTQVLTFDAVTRRWQRTNPLPKNKGEGPSAVTIRNSIYLLGGGNDATGLNILTEGDPIWKVGPSSSYNHVLTAATAYNDNIYACASGSNACEMYNTGTKSWTQIVSMLSVRIAYGLVTLEDRIYAIGGSKGNNEVFDPMKQRWSYISDMSVERERPAVATDGIKIYAIGGNTNTSYGGTFYDTVEVYRPQDDTWHQKSDRMSSRRAVGNAIYLANVP